MNYFVAYYMKVLSLVLVYDMICVHVHMYKC